MVKRTWYRSVVVCSSNHNHCRSRASSQRDAFTTGAAQKYFIPASVLFVIDPHCLQIVTKHQIEVDVGASALKIPRRRSRAHGQPATNKSTSLRRHPNRLIGEIDRCENTSKNATQMIMSPLKMAFVTVFPYLSIPQSHIDYY